MIEKLQEESLKTVRTSIVIPSAISSSSSTTTAIDLEPLVTEPDSYFTERQSVKDTKIYELKDQIAELLKTRNWRKRFRCWKKNENSIVFT